MSVFRRMFLFTAVLITIILISGCAPSQQPAVTPSPTVLPQQTEPASTPTQPPTPTATALPPTPTITSSPTIVPSETPTSTPAPQTDFSEAVFYTAGFPSKWNYFFAIQLPSGTIQGDYYAVVDENKEYTCEVLAAYPDRLYCTGPLAAANDFIDYAIYEKDSNLKVFEGNIFVPLQ